MADDCADSRIHEQMILYVRYLNMQLQSVGICFLGVKTIEGHPNTETLYSSMMSVIGSEGSSLCVPTGRLVSSVQVEHLLCCLLEMVFWESL